MINNKYYNCCIHYNLMALKLAVVIDIAIVIKIDLHTHTVVFIHFIVTMCHNEDKNMIASFIV